MTTLKSPIVNATKFDLYGRPVSDAYRKPRFSWASRDGNPRFSVYVNNNKSKEDKGDFIFSGFSIPVFLAAMSLAYEFYSDDQNLGKHISVANHYGERGEDGKPTGTNVLTTLLVFGIDEDGKRWIMAVDKKKKETPKVKFYLECSDYHYFIDKDGKKLSEAVASKSVALNYIKAVKEYFSYNISPTEAMQKPDIAVTTGKNHSAGNNSYDDDVPF